MAAYGLVARLTSSVKSTHGFGERQAIEETLEALLQVEVEVWEKVIERIETMMELENESTDDQVWEFRDWCREQAKEVR